MKKIIIFIFIVGLIYLNLHLPQLVNGATIKEANALVNEFKIFPAEEEDSEIVVEDVIEEPIDEVVDDVLPNYHEDLEDRYQAYQLLNETLSYEEVVYDVNLNRDINPYTNITEIENYSDTDVLVNKYYQLPSDYIPSDLVSLDSSIAYEGRMVRELILEDLLDMFDSAKNDGYQLVVLSAFRSYTYQEEVYNRYVERSGQEKADEFSARPGHSEHQTGLCVDLVKKDDGGLGGFVGSVEAEWVALNAYQYGFVITYPEDKVDVTHYQYEPWHIRYVGVELATYLYENNLTLDEYHALKEVN